MPYIDGLRKVQSDNKQVLLTVEDRAYIDEALAEFQGMDISMIGDILRRVPSGKTKGAFNYLVSRLWLNTFFWKGRLGYTSLSDAIAVFPDMEFEIRRRLLAKYEDNMIIENGDLPEFNELLKND